ncbi:MAG: Anaerobic nitric oxide reductase transcription regulator NorR [Myxococcota bacterium]|nr:Anaerobic nitric oxide reductase transcription regulator NorR [Myxococcota bacterium]
MSTTRLFLNLLDATGLPIRSIPLTRPVSTIGSGPGNDLSISGEGISACHLRMERRGEQILCEGVDRGAEFLHNGKKIRKAVIAPGEQLRAGGYILQPGPRLDAPSSDASELQHYRKLHEFCRELSTDSGLAPLLDKLLEKVLEVTKADRGFLVLMEEGRPRVVSARVSESRNIVDTDGQISDSIVRKVIETREPLIVSDALNDSLFQSADSVVNLKLASVMCAPLIDRGKLLGVLFAGNNRVANLFTQVNLDVLTVFAAQAAMILSSAILVGELKDANTRLRERLETQAFGSLVGDSPSMREIYRKVEKIAGADVTVLITGETGVGKELIAREIHRRSPRSKGPFVGINCGAIPENLLESELFGHVRGAFTGAVATRPGKFMAAHGGSLFLDEIGEMPLQLQVKLLRVLQDRTVVKVGDTRPEAVDIRVIAATNQDLEEMIREGRFREDLYFRLNVITLRLPPLRERDRDILLIANYLLRKIGEEYRRPNLRFDAAAEAAMLRHGWPGNIRELENRIRKAAVLSGQVILTQADLELDNRDESPVLPLAEARERFEARYIDEVLNRNGGNRTKTARDLGVDPRTIFRYLEKKAGR